MFSVTVSRKDGVSQYAGLNEGEKAAIVSVNSVRGNTIYVGSAANEVARTFPHDSRNRHR